MNAVACCVRLNFHTSKLVYCCDQLPVGLVITYEISDILTGISLKESLILRIFNLI